MATNTQVDKTYGSYDLERTKEQVKQAIEHAYNRSIDEAISYDELDTDLQNTIDAKTTEAKVEELIEAWGATHGGDSFYGECNTAANVANKTVQISGFTSDNLVSGQRVTVYFNLENTAANPTLNVSSTGIRFIKQYGIINVPKNAWKSGQAVDFIYHRINDTGYWIMCSNLSNMYYRGDTLPVTTSDGIYQVGDIFATPTTGSITGIYICTSADNGYFWKRLNINVFSNEFGIDDANNRAFLFKNCDEVNIDSQYTSGLYHYRIMSSVPSSAPDAIKRDGILVISNYDNEVCQVMFSSADGVYRSYSRVCEQEGSSSYTAWSNWEAIEGSGGSGGGYSFQSDLFFDSEDNLVGLFKVANNVTIDSVKTDGVYQYMITSSEAVASAHEALKREGVLIVTVIDGYVRQIMLGNDATSYRSYSRIFDTSLSGATWSEWKEINGVARDYDTTGGTIKAKFDSIDLDVDDLKMIQKRDNSTAVCINDGNNRIISSPTEWDSILPLQDGQRLTVRFTNSILAVAPDSSISFTIDGDSAYPFCPNGIDTCTTNSYPADTPIIVSGTLTTIEFHKNNQYPNGCWQLTDLGFCETACQAEKVGIDFNETKLLQMDNAIDNLNHAVDNAKYYDGQVLIPTAQNQFTWDTPSNGTVSIIKYNGSATNVVVPAEYYLNGNTYEVTGLIGQPNPSDPEVQYDGVFDGNGNIETVVLPNTITTIGKNAFNGCISLESVNVPSSVTVIGESAFKACTDLTSLIIGGIAIVDNNAFLGCSNLTVYCYQDSEADDVAAVDNIPVEYLDDVITYDTTSVTIDTIKNGKEYRCLNTGLTSLTVRLPAMDTSGVTNIKTEFDSLVTFYCGSSSFQFSGAYPSTGTQFIQYFGKDCDDGVFLPSEQGYVYNLAYWWNGKMYVCTVV